MLQEQIPLLGVVPSPHLPWAWAPLPLLLQGAVVALASGVDSSFYPRYATEALGLSVTRVGVVFSVYPLLRMLASPLAGHLCSVLGYTAVLYTGLGLLLLGTVTFGLTPKVVLAVTDPQTPLSTHATLSFGLFLGSAMVQAVGIGCAMTALLVGLSQLSSEVKDDDDEGQPPAHGLLGNALGQFETAQGVGYAIGALSGGYLYEWRGFFVPFLAAAVALFAVAWLPKPSSKVEVEVEVDMVPPAAVSHLRLAPPSTQEAVLTCALAMLASCLISTGFTATSPILPLYYAQAFAGRVSTVGTLYSLSSVAYAGASVAVGQLCYRRGDLGYSFRLRLTAAGLAVCALCYLLLSTSLAPVFDGAIVAYGASAAVVVVATETTVVMVIQAWNAEYVGMALGLEEASFAFGGIAGPLLGAFLWSHSGGFTAIWATVGSTLAASACAYATLSYYSERQGEGLGEGY